MVGRLGWRGDLSSRSRLSSGYGIGSTLTERKGLQMGKLAPPRPGDVANAVMPLCRRLYAASVLTPRSPIVDWLSELDAALQQSEQRFADHPVVLDLAAVRLSPHAIMHLISNLEERSIRIMGIEGTDSAASPKGLPPVLCRHHEQPGRRAKRAPRQAAATAQTVQPASLLIDDFVRSGQCVSFMEGDVTVVGSVGSGAEIVAGGSIHVYGTLRGRAMAGAHGNTRARIFCQDLEAELVAIGPHFKTADQIEQDLCHEPVQVWLEGVELNISVMR
jgi:septum site-determining protein MinC